MPYLDTYSGTWSAKEARHLLKRSSFGITQLLVAEAVSLGLTGSINKLFTIQPLPDPPLKFLLDEELIDPDAKYGETWVNGKPAPGTSANATQNKILNRRARSLYAWTFLQMQNSGISIREKLTLFWHNHFVANNNNPHREYVYQNLLRTNALGNFKELTKLITVDTNMLIYLDGKQNTNASPNENYSRELLELFTIGKGDAVGNGDYTFFTEDDVVEMAKALTGWRVRGLAQDDTLISYFQNNKHTSGNKQLSHRFNNDVIAENGENEYKDLIDRIFLQEECSKFITRKLYRWFVNSEITEEIETNIIEPLALIVRNDDYEISGALKTLLSSEHFFESTACMIKSPIDLVFSITSSLFVNAPKSSVKGEYEFAYLYYQFCLDLDQEIFKHPNVAGWKAYYQEPAFYKTWINTVTIPKRLDYCKKIVTGGNLLINKRKYPIPPLVPVLNIVAAIPNATDPNLLIKELSNQLFNYEISENQINALKEILIAGLPDFEWTVEYSEYLADPNDEAKRISVENKLRALIGTMVEMSEFQIM